MLLVSPLHSSIEVAPEPLMLSPLPVGHLCTWLARTAVRVKQPETSVQESHTTAWTFLEKWTVLQQQSLSMIWRCFWLTAPDCPSHRTVLSPASPWNTMALRRFNAGGKKQKELTEDALLCQVMTCSAGSVMQATGCEQVYWVLYLHDIPRHSDIVSTSFYRFREPGFGHKVLMIVQLEGAEARDQGSLRPLWHRWFRWNRFEGAEGGYEGTWLWAKEGGQKFVFASRALEPVQGITIHIAPGTHPATANSCVQSSLR